MNLDRRYALCIQKLYHSSHFTVGGSWNKSLHLQPLQRCYCEDSESPASACVMRHHYCITYTQSLHASSSLFCPRAGPSLQTQAPRLQFCPKAGLPLQTQESRLQFYYGWIGAVASRCFPYPTLSLSLFIIWTILKRSEKIAGALMRRRGEWIWLTGPSGLHRNSPQGLNISSIRVFDRAGSDIRKS